MKHGNKANRLNRNELDKRGITTMIVRIGPGKYQMIVNYEVVRQYKTRHSCNNYIAGLLSGKIKVKKYILCRPVKKIMVKRFKKKRNNAVQSL